MNRRKILYIVTGMPAVGKTSFARELAKTTNACLIDIDTATESVVQAAMNRIVGDPHDRDSSVFKKTFREPIYHTLFSLADANLPHTDTIVTGPFTKELSDSSWHEQIENRLTTPCRIRCIFLRCSPEQIKKRLKLRSNPRDRAKLENWSEYLKYYKTEAPPAYPHFYVDTEKANAFELAIENGLID